MCGDSYERLLKAQNGDVSSLETIVLEYKALVCKIAREYYLFSGGDSDDLVQEGTVGLINAVKTFQPEKNKAFVNYAAMCIRNKIKDALRASVRDKNRLLNEALVLDNVRETAFPEEAGNDPYAEFIDREETEAFYARMKATLSERQYDVLLLYLEGYSYVEIAARLSLSLKSVDNALSAAKIKLKKTI